MKLINTKNDFSQLFGAFDDIKQQKLTIEDYKLKFKNLNVGKHYSEPSFMLGQCYIKNHSKFTVQP